MKTIYRISFIITLILNVVNIAKSQSSPFHVLSKKEKEQLEKEGWCLEAGGNFNKNPKLNAYVANYLKITDLRGSGVILPSNVEYTGHHAIIDDEMIKYDWQNKPLYRYRTIIVQFKSKDGSKEGCYIENMLLLEHHTTGNQYAKGEIVNCNYRINNSESGNARDDICYCAETNPGKRKWYKCDCFEKETPNWLEGGKSVSVPAISFGQDGCLPESKMTDAKLNKQIAKALQNDLKEHKVEVTAIKKVQAEYLRHSVLQSTWYTRKNELGQVVARDIDVAVGVKTSDGCSIVIKTVSQDHLGANTYGDMRVDEISSSEDNDKYSKKKADCDCISKA
jgi:hypothetical protein